MSYLEGYGVREARQEKKLRYGIGIVLLAVIAGIIFYFWQRDRSEKQKVEAFLENLRKGDYKAAHALWGCTDAKPCRDYGFDRFMEDWGPQSPQRDAAHAKITGGQHCRTGAIRVIEFPGNKEVQVFVDRAHDEIGFAPWPMDTNAATVSFRYRLRDWMRDLMGDCSPPPMKVP